MLILLGDGGAVRAQQINQTPNPGAAIRVNVERVNLGVTVTGMHGNFIKGLGRADFQVFDNGVEQPVTDFLSIEEPNQLVLMMESGPGAFFLKRSEIQTADELLGDLSPTDRVAIVGYSNGPEMILDFTPDKSEARAAIHRINFIAGFAELNLASSVAATLDWLGSVTGKKTIVLLSSGVDTSSAANWQNIQQKIQTSDVRILAVSVTWDLRKPGQKRRLSTDERNDRQYLKEGFSESDQNLRQLSEATGGRSYMPKNAKELAHAYAEIAQSVQYEYNLAFAPTLHDGLVHSLRVKVRHPWCHVHSRQAYLAPSATMGAFPRADGKGSFWGEQREE